MTNSLTVAADASPTSPGIGAEDLACFDELAALAHGRAGLVLSRDKAPMVLARVGKRMRAVGTGSLKEYCHYIAQPDAEPERQELIYTLTTNVTSFMREEHHFQTIRSEVAPVIAAAARQGQQVRLWSAGCSSGQEPYSLAMTLLDVLPDAGKLDVKILATDIDANILAQARSATYSEQQIAGLAKGYRQKFMRRCSAPGAGGDSYTVNDDVKQIVSFRELNLLEEWPMKKKFHLIMCRNVVIYFNRDTQRKLWTKFSNALIPNGYLFLGHSERLDTGEFMGFRASGTTTYQLTA